MSCHAWQHLFQQHLDGDCAGELERHLHSCPDCAAEQPVLRRFLDGVSMLAPVSGPVGLADQITEQLVKEARRQRRQRQRRLVGAFGMLAAAAVLLVAVGIRSWWGHEPDAQARDNKPDAQAREGEKPLPPNPSPRSKEEGAKPLRDSLAQAGTAVASLTSRAASETVDQTTSLLPMLPTPTLDPMPAEPASMEPLREASASVSAGLAPVADSARRAVGLFLRDLPMGRNGG
jgi:hypothetical protein